MKFRDLNVSVRWRHAHSNPSAHIKRQFTKHVKNKLIVFSFFSLFLRLVIGFFLKSFKTGYCNFPHYIQALPQGVDDNGFKSYQKQEIPPPLKKNVRISSVAHPRSYSIDYDDISPEVGGWSLKFPAHLPQLPRLGISRTILLLPLYALIVRTGATLFVCFWRDRPHSQGFYITHDAPQSSR